MKETEQGYLLKIRNAIEQKDRISFKYLRPDGQMIRHNAVYPREIFRKGNHIFFKAYCHFTKDVRLFRLDRVQSLRLTSTEKRFTTRQEIIGAIIAIVFLLIVFLCLLFFSPKYRWRSLRKFILMKLGIDS